MDFSLWPYLCKSQTNHGQAMQSTIPYFGKMWMSIRKKNTRKRKKNGNSIDLIEPYATRKSIRISLFGQQNGTKIAINLLNILNGTDARLNKWFMAVDPKKKSTQLFYPFANQINSFMQCIFKNDQYCTAHSGKTVEGFVENFVPFSMANNRRRHFSNENLFLYKNQYWLNQFC